MEHKSLLKALGGEHVVHAALVAKGAKIEPVTVRAWSLSDRSIPAKYWAAIKELADEKGVPLTLDDLAQSVRAA